MSLRRRVFVTKLLQDMHFHGKNLAKSNNPEIDTNVSLAAQCGAASSTSSATSDPGPVMVRCRRRQSTARHKKVYTAETTVASLSTVYLRYQ